MDARVAEARRLIAAVNAGAALSGASGATQPAELRSVEFKSAPVPPLDAFSSRLAALQVSSEAAAAVAAAERMAARAAHYAEELRSTASSVVGPRARVPAPPPQSPTQAWLVSLRLERFDAALAELGVAELADLREVTADDLETVGAARLHVRRFLAAAAGECLPGRVVRPLLLTRLERQS
jgi:hypothetical protein